jgi:hypothetical protein
MGWWQIASVDSGQMALMHGQNSELAGEHLVTGDGPADIMGPAAEGIVKLYEKAYGRKPKRREMIATLNFAMGGLELEE